MRVTVRRIFGHRELELVWEFGFRVFGFPMAFALLGKGRLNDLVEHLVEALREELKQYGEMLALLEHQRKLAIPRHAPDLLQNFSVLREHANMIQIAREEREQRRRHLTRTLELDETAPMEKLIVRLPSAYRPLVQALVDENAQLVRRVQQRARQNHLLLQQSVGLMEQFTQTLLLLSGPQNAGGSGSAPATAGRAG